MKHSRYTFYSKHFIVEITISGFNAAVKPEFGKKIKNFL